MMKNTITQSIIALGSAIVMSAAIAEGGQFGRLDTNADGYISAGEAVYDHNLSARWESTDTNMDGQIDPIEFSAFEAAGSTEAAGAAESAEPAQESAK